MNKKEPVITESELMDELEKYRPPITYLTPEQFEFIYRAREHKRPIMWSVIADLFVKRGWGEINITTLKCRYATSLRKHRKDTTQ